MTTTTTTTAMRPLEGWAVVACVAIVVVSGAAFVPDVVGVVAEFVAAFSFLVWCYRARVNVGVLVDDVEFMAPRWVVLWWFVPFASAFMPLRAMRQIVEASKSSSTNSNYWTTNSPWWVGAWWVCFIASGLVDAIADGAPLSQGRDEFLIAFRVVVDVIAAAFAVFVVVRVTLWQRQAWKRKSRL